jgi:O-antigen ligase
MGRFTEIFNADGALYERMPRLAFWKVHLAMFLDHPVFGVGLTDIKAITADYYQNAGFASLERKYAAHNVYLQTLADSGILGLSGLFALLTGSFLAGRLIVRSAKANGKAYKAQLGFGWQVLVVAVALSGLMQNNLRDSEHVMALWLAMAAMLTRMPAKIKWQPKAHH